MQNLNCVGKIYVTAPNFNGKELKATKSFKMGSIMMLQADK
jgi:hypothetical protein